MARQFFGTDGIRGRVNQKPMTVETALRLSIAAARAFAPDGGRDVIVGRDTRRSGEMIEAAIVAGLSSMGLTPVCVGIVPTPAVALLTRETGAAFGLMVTASHNKFQDNGLKLFSPDGVKFTDEVEEALETGMFDAFEGSYAAPADVVTPRKMEEGVRRYVERCLEAVEPEADFSKLKVVLDCANGAA
ncbi:MAG TPA: phosphoglucosamine mutase, partial [Hyphomonas adhaerens]|nr:phosphoglucosamine mutase [Hyphomonas adhaerens]